MEDDSDNEVRATFEDVLGDAKCEGNTVVLEGTADFDVDNVEAFSLFILIFILSFKLKGLVAFIVTTECSLEDPGMADTCTFELVVAVLDPITW